ncbi:haloacid dehalogenase [Luteitalea sp. TBR-22]|uniref:KdsC family phosphatase n=1 Tax=Luteitalea sp. TBR-22 TaxID=2802971 RepID=UPI001AF0C366|nr:HAD-IIIA family hydrolase [Luteitalea sp. TBR-22]BCS33844.1 haloacid dehalogenase [Luteitalea sp. TBR-22]
MSTQASPDVTARARNIRVLLFDVDGVLTDGGVYVHADGSESKRFDIKDGAGIVIARRAGLVVGVISARHSASTLHRARQLGLDPVRQGVADKAAALDDLVAAHGWSVDSIAYMGDDVVDLPVMRRVGLAACPADAVPEVRAAAHVVSPCPGGRGAARSLIEDILRAQGRWDALIDADADRRP